VIDLRAASLVAGLALSAGPFAWAQGGAGNPVDARVAGSFNAAQSYQGPMDGSWTLVSTSGQALLAFELVDKPGGAGPLEGVWRDLRHPPVPGDIGFVDSLVRGPGSLTITLNAAPGEAAKTVTLHADPTGGWSGTLNEGGADAAVKLRRG